VEIVLDYLSNNQVSLSRLQAISTIEAASSRVRLRFVDRRSSSRHLVQFNAFSFSSEDRDAKAPTTDLQTSSVSSGFDSAATRASRLRFTVSKTQVKANGNILMAKVLESKLWEMNG
jgi:hypothetical protein